MKLHTFSKAVLFALLAQLFTVSSLSAQISIGPIGPIEPIDPTPPPTLPCAECDGKINNIVFRYDGAYTGYIEVESRRGQRYQTLFAGYVDSGDQFTVTGTNNLLDKKGTLGATIYITENGGDTLALHTSCSQPIGPGTVVGKLVVILAMSRNGGLTCPVDDIPLPPDA